MLKKLAVKGIEKQVAMEEQENRVLSRLGRESEEQGLRCCWRGGSTRCHVGYCEDLNRKPTWFEHVFLQRAIDACCCLHCIFSG